MVSIDQYYLWGLRVPQKGQHEIRDKTKSTKSYSECYHNTFTCPISAITEDRDLNQSSMWQQKQLTHRIMRIFPHKCTPRLLFNSCIFPFTQTVSLYPSRSVTPMLKKKPNYTKCYTNCCKNLWYLRYLPLISNLLILLSYWASFMYVVCLVL